MTQTKTYYYPNGAIKYTGEIANGSYHGHGVEYLSDKQLFVSKWDNDDFTLDVAWFMLEIFEGQFKNGNPDGKGSQKYITYERNVEDGKCTNNYKVELVHEYKGNWKAGQFIEGEYYYKGKLVNKGFRKGLSLHGQGAIYHDNGRKQLEANFIEGTPSGHGVSYFCSGKKQYDGSWNDGVAHGQGTSHYSNGKIEYYGQFKNGKKSGKGVMYSKNGEITHTGKWINDEFIGEDRYYMDSIKWFFKFYRLKAVFIILILIVLYVYSFR